MTLIRELHRRNVIRMAGLYLVGAWLITQVAERAWAQHDGGLLRIDTEPMLAPLWKDPRYPALRRKVGFIE